MLEYVQSLLDQLHAEVGRLSEYDKRQLLDWQRRVDDQDTFDRQDIRDINEMVEGL